MTRGSTNRRISFMDALDLVYTKLAFFGKWALARYWAFTLGWPALKGEGVMQAVVYRDELVDLLCFLINEEDDDVVEMLENIKWHVMRVESAQWFIDRWPAIAAMDELGDLIDILEVDLQVYDSN